jgi:hypothetical protein
MNPFDGGRGVTLSPRRSDEVLVSGLKPRSQAAFLAYGSRQLDGMRFAELLQS